MDPDSVPNRLANRGRRSGRVKLPRIAFWLEPRETPDSARATHIPLTRFGEPPREGQVLEIQVQARPLFPSPDEGRNVLRDDALIQITDLGLSALTGNDRGIAWVTRLSSGLPVESAEVRLFVPGLKKAIWTGKTDGEGLVWIPGLSDLPLLPGTPLVTEVRSAKDAAWLDVPTYSIRRRGDSTDGASRVRVFVMTDRPLYRPGETVHWVAFARTVGREGIGPASVSSLDYTITGPTGQAADAGRIDLTAPGTGSGSYKVPAGAPLGSYSLGFHSGAGTERVDLSGGSFNIQEFRLPRFEARVEAPMSRVVSGSTAMIDGRFAYLGGGPLAGAPIRWTLSRHPDWSRPEGFWDYSFQDERPSGMEERVETDGTIRVASGEGTLDAEGRIRLPITPDLSGLAEDQTYLLEVGARDIADRSAYDVVSFPAQRASNRIGARARIDPDPIRGTRPEPKPTSGSSSRLPSSTRRIARSRESRSAGRSRSGHGRPSASEGSAASSDTRTFPKTPFSRRGSARRSRSRRHSSGIRHRREATPSPSRRPMPPGARRAPETWSTWRGRNPPPGTGATAAGWS